MHPLKFGIFDHLDRGAIPLEQYYAARLRLIEMYDESGFYAYHVAEHHATPLGMAPSPNLFWRLLPSAPKSSVSGLWSMP